MDQNLNLYQVFFEVAKCRNFSVAAGRLQISQPAVSKSIARLEESLGILLFHRSPRGVALTAEGEILLRHVETALSSIHSGEELLKSGSAQGIRHLSIGVSTTLCKYILLPLLKDFVSDNPQIKITISCQPTLETIASIKKGTVDIGLVGIPSDAAADSRFVSYLPLKTIEDIFVGTENYLAPFLRNAGSGKSSGEAVENAAFIMLDKENISRRHADAFLSSHHLFPGNIIEVNNMDLSIEFAKAGLGIACVISDFVKEDLQKGTLHELKFKYKVPKRQIGFVYPAKQPPSGAMNTLIRYYQRY